MAIDKSRMTKALTDMKEAGIPAGRALIVVATSANETSSCFGVDRTDALIYPKACYPRRQILRLEKGRSASNPLPKAWTDDKELMDRLLSMGFIATSGSNRYVSSQSGVTAIDTCASPNNAAAYLFELLIDQRKLAALQAFSIGPTQMFLAYSPGLGASPGISSRFKTIDELWAFYTARSTADLMKGNNFDYLPTNRADTPAPGVALSTIESYLAAVQTGKVDWANPTWDTYAKGFQGAVNTTWDIARSIKYPGVS